MQKIRTLIVDDESLARRKIRSLLEREPDVEIVGECANGAAAVKAVQELSPDLMFLDIQMPGLDGFGTLQALESETLPAIVFVTAYDQHALRAFEVHALDYVLKPFDRERFQKVLTHVRREIERSRRDTLNQKLLALLKHLEPAREQKRLLVKKNGNIFFVRHEEIDWVEAADNYVRLHVAGDSYLLRDSLSNLAAKLDRRIFARIHRSTIVNVERIKKLQPLFHGDHQVTLKDGTRLILSRTYRQHFERVVGHTI